MAESVKELEKERESEMKRHTEGDRDVEKAEKKIYAKAQKQIFR